MFLWVASVATARPLPDEDPLRDWLDRSFDLFGSLGRNTGPQSTREETDRITRSRSG